MKRPDKYPPIDPRLPDLYGRIIEAAERVRAERQTDTALAWAAIRFERKASLRRRDPPEEGPVVWKG